MTQSVAITIKTALITSKKAIFPLKFTHFLRHSSCVIWPITIKKRTIAVKTVNLKTLLLLPALFFLSSNSQAEPEHIWKNQVDYVSVSTLEGATNNNHPANIPAEKIARILSQIQVQDSPYNPENSFWDDELNLQRVFTDREIDLLGKKISEGLSRIKTNEVIKFSVSDYRSSFIGRKRLSVSGTVFIKDQQLNVLFGTVHGDLLAKQSRSGITGTYGRIKNDLDTGNILKPFPYDWKVHAFDGATKVNSRNDWLAINSNQNYEYAITKNEQQLVEEKYFTERQKSTETDALEARIKKLEQQTQAKPTVTASSGSIEERLRQLQSLYNSGSLPEPVYLEKVRSIMSEL